MAALSVVDHPRHGITLQYRYTATKNCSMAILKRLDMMDHSRDEEQISDGAAADPPQRGGAAGPRRSPEYWPWRWSGR